MWDVKRDVLEISNAAGVMFYMNYVGCKDEKDC